jgi:hypothetical protein
MSGRRRPRRGGRAGGARGRRLGHQNLGADLCQVRERGAGACGFFFG